MSRPIRVAALGFWHVHALEYAEAAHEAADAELVALWDDVPERAAEASDRFGLPVDTDLDALLGRDDIDAVTVSTATSEHVDVISRALRSGKHVFTEKVLAATVPETEALIRLAAERRRMLVVSLPRLSAGYTASIREILAAGTLGDLTYSRVRVGHDGWVAGWLPESFGDPAEAMGGAFTDFGCHPVYLTDAFHGRDPESVIATYASVTGRAVEDSAVVVASYTGGALAVMEASFVDAVATFTIELNGTRGSLRYGFAGETLELAEGSSGWRAVSVRGDEPPPFARWIAAIRSGQPDAENLAAALALTRVVAAANEFARAVG